MPEVNMLTMFIGIGTPIAGFKVCISMRTPMLKNIDFIDFIKGFGSLKILNMK